MCFSVLQLHTHAPDKHVPVDCRDLQMVEQQPVRALEQLTQHLQKKRFIMGLDKEEKALPGKQKEAFTCTMKWLAGVRPCRAATQQLA